MKGLLRGLRYISQIFDEKEPEMQIGYPTDVKHVAHIGWDGPSAAKPSWMNEFKTIDNAKENSNSTRDTMSDVSLYSSISDMSLGEKPKHRSRRASSAASSPMNSPDRRSTDGLKHSRRQPSSAISSVIHSAPKQSRRFRGLNTAMDSNREAVKVARRHQTSGLGIESPARDQPSIARHSHGRKKKESSKTKDKKSSTEMVISTDPSEATELKKRQAIKKNYASHLSSVLEAYEN